MDVLGPTLLPSVGDPELRAQLPAAVLARPPHDAVARDVWQQVARSLEVTGHAVACAQEGTDPGWTAVLAGCAAQETADAAALLAAPRTDRPPARVLPGAGRATDRRRSPVPAVERTWFRLAGLLVGPVPVDVRVLAAVLADHRAGLEAWRRVLLAPRRLAGARG